MPAELEEIFSNIELLLCSLEALEDELSFELIKLEDELLFETSWLEDELPNKLELENSFSLSASSGNFNEQETTTLIPIPPTIRINKI